MYVCVVGEWVDGWVWDDSKLWGQWGRSCSQVGVARAPPAPPTGCAGRAWNHKGSHITMFGHQMGRHPTIWDMATGILRRIPARISLWGSRALNPNFLFTHFGPPKCLNVDVG